MGKNLPCHINQLIWVMSENQTNLSPNLCNLIHHGLTKEAWRVMCSIDNFEQPFDLHTK
jgi:hypothetical protein